VGEKIGGKGSWSSEEPIQKISSIWKEGRGFLAGQLEGGEAETIHTEVLKENFLL